jgi:uncharacterized protein (DUF952 family)
MGMGSCWRQADGRQSGLWFRWNFVRFSGIKDAVNQFPSQQNRGFFLKRAKTITPGRQRIMAPCLHPSAQPLASAMAKQLQTRGSKMSSRLYKVLTGQEWQKAESEGVFRGSGIDLADGFIHLSSSEQVVETVRLHFGGTASLVLVAIDPDQIGDTLKWEASRGGALFPHVYGELPLTAVIATHPLPWVDGAHQFPPDL